MSCSCDETVASAGARPGFRRALVAVIAINGVMFVVEMTAGSLGDSQALKADALDFLGDSLTYAMSLAVAGMALRWRSRAALVKGVTLGALGVWVLAATAYQTLVLGVPDAGVMGGVGVLACLANLASVLILLKHREGDANVRSVWLCSRNDALGNVAVVLAASGVWASSSPWPDLAVAAGLAGLFVWSAVAIVRRALGEMRMTAPAE
ncbi:Cation efflux family protein [Limimonas halophila]|uniref:Cation efflux family protein n=1 Tax=Limimonas halophila TaxID=1082479 RepID=A0A1G7R7Y9_9PROT|nr:cation transporter [Limimonas halophila]SDG06833.1 Cation efflux family protein [Limimonas halophila]